MKDKVFNEANPLGNPSPEDKIHIEKIEGFPVRNNDAQIFEGKITTINFVDLWRWVFIKDLTLAGITEHFQKGSFQVSIVIFSYRAIMKQRHSNSHRKCYGRSFNGFHYYRRHWIPSSILHIAKSTDVHSINCFSCRAGDVMNEYVM